MPGDREICVLCEARERGEEPPKPPDADALLFSFADSDEEDVAGQALHVTGRPFRTDLSATSGPPAPPRFSRLAFASAILALLLGPAGIVAGFLALKAIYAQPRTLKGAFVAWGAVFVGVAWLLAVGLIGHYYLVIWAAGA